MGHMEENQAASACDGKLIPDSHKDVPGECLATVPEQASLSPSVTRTFPLNRHMPPFQGLGSLSSQPSPYASCLALTSPPGRARPSATAVLLTVTGRSRGLRCLSCQQKAKSTERSRQDELWLMVNMTGREMVTEPHHPDRWDRQTMDASAPPSSKGTPESLMHNRT